MNLKTVLLLKSNTHHGNLLLKTLIFEVNKI